MSRQRIVAGLAAVSLTGLAACAGPPSSGPLVKATLNQNQNQISITAKPPYPGIDARGVVEGFLAATAGDDGDPTFQVAQQFMKDGVGKAWAAGAGITAGDAIVYAENQPRFEPQAITPDGSRAAPASDPNGGEGETTTVTATVTQIAGLGDGGFYQPTPRTTVPVTFRLGKVKTSQGPAEWRIIEPPAKRLISIADLRRAYQPLPVFEPIGRSASQSTATVNQVYVVPSDTKHTYDTLVKALLRGSDGGDDVPVPAGPVTLDQSKSQVVVQLDSIPKSGNGLPRWTNDTLAAALAETFQAAAPFLQLSGNATPFTSLVLKVGSVETTKAIPASSGGSYPAVYFAVNGSVVAARWSPTDAPGAAPKGVTVLEGGPNPVRTFGEIAVRQEKLGGEDGGQLPDSGPIRIAALVTSKGSGFGDIEVYQNLDPNRNNAVAVPVPWYRAADPKRVTDLTWDPIDNSLWVVDDGKLFNVQQPQGGVMQTPVPVDPVDASPYQRIRLSPDGQLAVVVTGTEVDKADSDSPTAAHLAKIIRPDTRPSAGAGPDRLQLLEQYPIQPTQPAQPTQSTQPTQPLHISDVAWAGGRTIVLLAKEQGDGQGAAPPKLYKVYADGSQDARLADSVEQSEGNSTTRIAAIVSDAGSPQPRIFSNGLKVDDQTQTHAIYWKGKTFDYFSAGDSPVVATRLVPGS